MIVLMIFKRKNSTNNQEDFYSIEEMNEVIPVIYDKIADEKRVKQLAHKIISVLREAEELSPLETQRHLDAWDPKHEYRQ